MNELLDAHMRTSFARAERTGLLLSRAGRRFGYDSTAFVELAVDSVLAAQTEQAFVTWSYLASVVELADPLGRVLDVDPPIDVLVGAATHDGAPLETVYRRPATLAAELRAEGFAFVEVVERVSSEVELMADADVFTASRKTEQVYGAVDRRIVGWRRVPNATACQWCRMIATQRYKKQELAPAHRSCHCGTAPITSTTAVDRGPVYDPDALAQIKRDGVPTRYGERKKTAREANTQIERFGDTVES